MGRTYTVSINGQNMISTRKQLELKLLFQSHRRHSWGLEGRAQWRSYSIYCAGCAKHKGPRLSEGPLRSWDPRRSWTPRALSGYKARQSGAPAPSGPSAVRGPWQRAESFYFPRLSSQMRELHVLENRCAIKSIQSYTFLQSLQSLVGCILLLTRKINYGYGNWH